MNSRKILLVLVILLLFIGVPFILFRNTEEVSVTEIEYALALPKEQKEQILTEAQEFQEMLLVEDGFYDQLKTSLYAANYDEFSIHSLVHRKDLMEITIFISSIEATEAVQQEVQTIFYETASANHLNTEAFLVTVSNQIVE